MSAKRHFPNLLSLIRIVLTPLVIIFLCRGDSFFISSILIFTLAVFTDFYDGYFARKYSVTTSAGNFLDPLADKFLVLGTFATFWHLDLLPFWIFFIITVREILVTGLRFYIERCGRSMKTSWLGKWKTAFQFIAIYALFCMHGRLFFMTQALLSFILYGAILITICSGIHYFIKNKSMFLSRARTRDLGH